MTENLADLGKPFFAAAAVGRLAIPRCRSCGRLFFYPTVLCPHCHSPEHEWVEASGTGRVYSFTVIHRAPVPGVDTPYVVATVELDEGVRLMSKIIECDPEEIAVDMPVEVVFGEGIEGRPLPLFRPRGR